MKTLCILLFLLCVPFAHATVRYVARPPAGDDARSCATSETLGTPKATISNALLCLQPGDTTYVRGGTYPEEVRVLSNGGSSWSLPTTIAAYPGETVIMQPSGTEYNWLYGFAASGYSILDGLHLDTTLVATGTVIRITSNAHHIRIINCEIYSTNQRDAQGILSDGTGHEFINNHIHHIADSHFVHGIYHSGDNALIQGNHIHHVNGFGIHVFSNASNSPHDNNVNRNLIHDTNNAPDGASQSAIILASGLRNIAYSNIVYNNHRGIECNYGGHDCQVYDNTIYNNHGGGGDGILIAVNSAIVRGNISYANDQNYTDGGFGTVQNTNLFGVNPQFVNPGVDFHLLSGSPAVGTGVCLAAVPVDFAGATRVAPCDIGAYIFATSVTNLFVSVQPTGGLSNASLPSWTVQARDSGNNVVTSHTGGVSIVIGTNPGGALLSGVTSKFFTAGVANWTGLSLNKIGTGYTYVVSAPALASVTTGPFTITGVPPGAPTNVRAIPLP